MRILFLSHYFYPEGNAPASRVFELCKRWARAGNEVTVITCAPNVPNGVVYDGYRNQPLSVETIEGVRVVRVWTWIAANKGTLRRIANFVSYMFSSTLAALHEPKPDVVIATSPQFFCGWSGVLTSRLCRVPLILEIRDLWPDSIVAVGAMKNRRLLDALYAMERRMYAAADHIVTVGGGYRDELLKKGVSESDISVIPNGVDSDLFYPRETDAEIRRRYGLDGAFVCAYVGTIGMACGLDVALQAAGQWNYDRPLKMLLVGDGARREALQRRAEQQGLENVIFTGRVSKQDVPRILAASDACLVHLRNAELFRTVIPSKIFETAAMEKPIILGVRGSAADLLNRADAGICIEPENPAELIQAIEKLAADPGQAAKFGTNGRRFVLEHYNRDALAQEYLDILGSYARCR